MPPNDLRELKRNIYRQLKPYPEEPIDCDGPLYVALYDNQQDPIAMLQQKMDLAATDSLQFLSGCRGSGKTTELHRLRRRLEQNGYIVFHADALEYLNLAEPIEINELLVVLCAALSEHVEKLLGYNPAHEGYLARFRNYMANSKVVFDEFKLKAGHDNFGAEFKATLRTDETFRQKIATELKGRTREVKEQADAFVRDAVQWLREANPGATGIVFLFDSLEQIHGSTSNEKEVMASVERIFSQHREQLRMEEVHLVYTVPPWLRYSAPGAVHLEKMIPCVKLWQYDERSQGREACLYGWSVMREIISRRVGDENMSQVFGPPDGDGNYATLDRLISYCGGHFRDLLMLVSEAFVPAEPLEIKERDVDGAISNLRAQYPIAENDAEWLRAINETQLACLPSSEPADVSRFTRFLDHHLVLLFANGREWYDIHPVITDDVFKITELLRAQAASGRVPGP